MKIKLVWIPILAMLMTACITENIDVEPNTSKQATIQTHATIQARTGLPLLTAELLANDPTFLDLVNSSVTSSYSGVRPAFAFSDFDIESLSRSQVKKIIEDAIQLASEAGNIMAGPIYCVSACLTDYATCSYDAPEPNNCWAQYTQCIGNCFNGGGSVGNNPEPNL